MTRIDPATGEVLEQGERCENCTAALSQAAEAEMQLRGVERELTKQIRANTTLRNELAEQRMDTPDGKAAKALGRYWLVRLGKKGNAKVKEKRLKAIIARLRDGYEPSYIARAIDGAAEAATTNNAEAERLALIRVMQEAIRRLPERERGELRQLYRDAMKNIVRYDDLELICRDETKLERFHDLAERVNAPTLVGPAWVAEFEGAQFAEKTEDAPF